MARRPELSGAQVRGDHRLVSLDLVGRSVRDGLPIVQHMNAVAEVHDQPHVVLDDQDTATLAFP